ncbi:hypothetical protein ES703_70354 [subsurface metagenome]
MTQHRDLQAVKYNAASVLAESNGGISQTVLAQDKCHHVIILKFEDKLISAGFLL